MEPGIMLLENSHSSPLYMDCCASSIYPHIFGSLIPNCKVVMHDLWFCIFYAPMR